MTGLSSALRPAAAGARLRQRVWLPVRPWLSRMRAGLPLHTPGVLWLGARVGGIATGGGLPLQLGTLWPPQAPRTT